MGLGIMSDGIFALVAGAAGDFLRRNRRFLRFQRWFAGTSFIGLGVTAGHRQLGIFRLTTRAMG